MNETPMISGFWRRLAADLLDALLLFLLAVLVTRPVATQLYVIGEAGLWIGLAITFLYSGLLHTSIGSGQTLGKLLLRIQVLRTDGSWLSVPASFLRFLVLAYWTYNRIIFDALSSELPWIHRPEAILANGILIYAIFLGTIFLIPFHPLKRGLHDLIAGTVVVRKGQFDAVRLQAMANPEKEKKVFVILLAVFVLTLSSTWIFSQRHSELRGFLGRSEEIRQIANQNSDLQNVSVRWTSFYGRRDSQNVQERRLRISGFVPLAMFEDRKSCFQQAKKVFDALGGHPEVLEGFHWVDVYVRTGWNIGIASFYQATSHSFRVGTLARDADQYAKDVVRGSGKDSDALSRYAVLEKNPEISTWIKRYNQKEFVAIEQLFDEKMRARDELTWEFLNNLLSSLSSYSGEAGFRATKQLIDVWVQQRPQSWLPWTLRGIFYMQYAWQARGSGFANTISQGAYRPFQERLQIALDSLEKARRLNPKQPFAAGELVALSYALSLPRSRMEHYYNQSIEAVPWFTPAGENKVEYLTPKWGGTWKDVFSFVDQIKPKSKQYPLVGLAILLAHNEKAAFEPSIEGYFKNPEVWADIEKVYAQIFAAYPQEVEYHNWLAKIASDAHRFDVAAREFDIAGDRWVNRAGWKTLADYNNARAYAYAAVGWDLIEHNHDKEGAAMFYKSYDYRKDDSWVLEKLATWNRMSGHPEKAKEFEEAAAALKTHPPQTQGMPSSRTSK